MGITAKVVDGKTVYDVIVNIRSRLEVGIRVQRQKKCIRTKAEAVQIEKELLRDVAEEVGRLEGSGVPWKDLIEKWEMAHRLNAPGTRLLMKTTIWDNVAVLRRYTQSWLNRKCQDIKPGDVKKIFTEMEVGGYSRSRMKAVKSAINNMYQWGIEEGLVKGVSFSPASNIKLVKSVDSKPPQILTLAEIKKLLDFARAMDHKWYPIWAGALNTGMRSGELFALQWADVNFENRLITVSKSYNGRLKITKSTKAGYWRIVPMNVDLYSLLSELKAKAKTEDVHVFPRIGTWRRGMAAKQLREFCVGIGVPSVNFHALRACFATHLLNSHVPIPVVKKICGWTDEKVMSRYIRLAGIDVAGATEKLGFGAPMTSDGKVLNLFEFRIAKDGSEQN